MKSLYHKKYYEEVTRPKMGYKGRRKPFTELEKEYVKKNYLLKTSGIMCEELGVKRHRIKVIMRHLRLKTTRKQRRVLQRKKQVFSEERMKSMRTLGRLNGLKNPNQYKDGEIFIKKNTKVNDRLEKYIRVPNSHYQGRIVRLAVYNWEKVNGKTPKGHSISFKTDDYLNCELDNLVCEKKGIAAGRSSSELSDNYIIYLIEKFVGIERRDITPEIISLKRAQLLFDREITKKNNGKRLRILKTTA